MRLIVLLLLGPGLAWTQEDGVKCHSCLTHCRTIKGQVDPIKCDCQSEEDDMCFGSACFAKVEFFPEEATAVVQKGCVSDIPGGKKGCYFASNAESIHCFCSGDFCNTRHKLDNFMPSRLPTVECCECSERNGDECPQNGCLRTCKGNYCVLDFDGVEQGCGLGLPRLPLFLRTEVYPTSGEDHICARYEASKSHVMNGCVCKDTSGKCNELSKNGNILSKKVTQPIPGRNTTYCYSIRRQSSRPFGEEVYKDSTTCEGHFCFVALTTSEILLESEDFKHNYEDHKEFIGVTRPNYVLQAGCLNVDDPSKVTLGCSVETIGDDEELARHCVCSGSLCNFHHLLTESPDTRPKATKEIPGRSDDTKRIRVDSSHVSVLTSNSLNPVSASNSLFNSLCFYTSFLLLICLYI